MAMLVFEVPAGAEGQRVDAFLKKNAPQLDDAALRSVFQHRDVKVNGIRVKPADRLLAHQSVQVYFMEYQEREPLDVVYEDADVLLINKRAGISVEEDDAGGVTVSQLAARYIQKASQSGQLPIACHRLDNQTSGLLLFAKTEEAAGILTDVFKKRTLDKRYVCLVKGQPKPPEAVCRAFLTKDEKAARVFVSDKPRIGAVPITTEYQTITPGPVSRLRIHLITGRTHQIRAHMAALGHPLLGDDVYGDRALNRAHHCQGKLMLCATSLTLDTQGRLPHLDGRQFEISCPF